MVTFVQCWYRFCYVHKVTWHDGLAYLDYDAFWKARRIFAAVLKLRTMRSMEDADGVDAYVSLAEEPYVGHLWTLTKSRARALWLRKRLVRPREWPVDRKRHAE